MSFQGIKKIRDLRKQSPIIFQSKQFIDKTSLLKSGRINMGLKMSNRPNPRSHRESELKADSLLANYRKSSLAMPLSKETDKKVVNCNFLHINLEGIKNSRPIRDKKDSFREPAKSDRLTKTKSNTQDYESDEGKISLSSFIQQFVVGKGGFGKVWKVRQKTTRQVFAMKEMQKVKIISKKSVRSVMNEKYLLQKLQSQFLVNMVHSFQDRENIYLIMDYCNRGDLRYHLGNKRKFREDEARFFLACIVICLEYLHSKKVIHRDLKPENLVLDDRGYLRVTDLGVSREVKPNNSEDTSGTPGYMAPQVICKMNHSYPVDFFALGIIAFEFMTGRRPYVGQNRKEIREKMLAKQVQLDEIPVFGWSKESVDFVNRLIQRKPENRLGYQSISEIKHHPFFSKIDWQSLQKGKMASPFLPPTIEQDYVNYKECISQDTQIQDVEEYNMILRHPQTQQAFKGYEFNIMSSLVKRKHTNKYLELFTHTALNLRKKK